ncbi:unnamed protein product [Polarella glacialis]|uniref:Uncharacterized protein n=1 Tax=Polarella glacialis TaxID=89957 RepID=A0A813JZ01_POLGL|nr:unnamed protein product [Polarella glacialis]
MLLPWRILSESKDAPCPGALRVRLLGFEGAALRALQGQEFMCEVRCGLPAGTPDGWPPKPAGPKLSTHLHAAQKLDASSAAEGEGPYLGFEAGSGPAELIFNLEDLQQLGELWCRVKVWVRSPGRLLGMSPGRFLGEARFAVPSSGPQVLTGNRESTWPLSILVEAAWTGLATFDLLRAADHLGNLLLNAARKSRWSEVEDLGFLAGTGGWDAAAQQCRALAVGATDSEGRTALRLCIDAGASAGEETADAAAAVEALLEAGADTQVVAADGDSPLTAAFGAGEPFTSMLVARASEGVAATVQLSPEPPFFQEPIDWEYLRGVRAFGIVLYLAEQLQRSWPSATASGTKCDCAVEARAEAMAGALHGALFHAVSRHLPLMGARIVAVLPPILCRASTPDVLLLEQMLQLASAAGTEQGLQWLAVAEAQLRRGRAANSWQSARRAVRQLAVLAECGQERAQQLLPEVALGFGSSLLDEPRALFPERAAECAVCFEPLFQNEPSFFLDGTGQRSCLHYVCGGCAESCVSSKECPMCRVSVLECKALPNLETDPRGWFAAAACFNGRLAPSELCHAIAACLPVSEEKLLAATESEEGPWKRNWDKKSDGAISEEQFFAPVDGLYAWVLAHLRELHRADQPGKNVAPDLRLEPAEWFDFWDDHGTASLAFGEVLRGAFVSHRISAVESPKRVKNWRSKVARLWRESGLQADNVSKSDFLRPDGLAEKLGQALQSDGLPSGPVSVASLPEAPSRERLSSPPATERSSRASDEDQEAQELAAALEASLELASSYNLEEEVSEEAEALACLCAMGFAPAAAAEALSRAAGVPEQAVIILLTETCS